jgi:hypothetical protein
MKRLSLALFIALPVLAAGAQASPLSDCYDKLIAKCTGDWGDATYRACVKGAMKHCDSRHSPKGLDLTIRPKPKSLPLVALQPRTPSSRIPGSP